MAQKIYFLHVNGSSAPKNEADCEYMISSDVELNATIQLLDLGIETVYCAHLYNGDIIKWEPIDDEVEVNSKDANKVVIATFKKVYERVGFIIWKNKSAI